MPNKIIYNGEIVESDCVSLGLNSQGFSFGYGLFETIKFLDKRPCFFKEHIARLEKSASAAEMKFPFSFEEVFRQSVALFNANGVRDGIFKIVITRTDSLNDVVVFLRSATETAASGPIRLRLSPVIKSSQAFGSRNKTLNYMENVLELRTAQQHGFDQCLFCNEAGDITECATANIFAVKQGALKTPSVDCGLLDGVIRGQVLRIASECGLRIEEGVLRLEELEESDGAFITSSGNGIVGVSEIWTDRLISYNKSSSKLLERLRDELHSAEIASTQVLE